MAMISRRLRAALLLPLLFVSAPGWPSPRLSHPVDGWSVGRLQFTPTLAGAALPGLGAAEVLGIGIGGTHSPGETGSSPFGGPRGSHPSTGACGAPAGRTPTALAAGMDSHSALDGWSRLLLARLGRLSSPSTAPPVGERLPLD